MGSWQEELLKAKLITKKQLKKNLRAKRAEDSASSDQAQEGLRAKGAEDKTTKESAQGSPSSPPATASTALGKVDFPELVKLVQQHRLKNIDGGRQFYFVNSKGVVRYIWVSPEIEGKLEAGELAIVELEERGEVRLVPKKIAKKILSYYPDIVCFFNKDE
ncbi:MAG: DUF2058 family protein [Planctomycetota bacterium]|nr:MAG: DUF2058 family protein [Planctomycetota bacterium]